MPAPAYSVADYTAALQALLPRGRVWPRDADATLTQVLAGLAAVYQRSNARANGLLIDAFPATSVELLPEWLSAVGIPGPFGPLAPTLAGQQAQVVAALTGAGGQSKAYFLALLLSLGLTATITEYTHFTVRSPVSRSISGDNWAHSWLVTIDGPPSNPVAEAQVTLYSPAHTVVAFKYTLPRIGAAEDDWPWFNADDGEEQITQGAST